MFVFLFFESFSSVEFTISDTFAFGENLHRSRGGVEPWSWSFGDIIHNAGIFCTHLVGKGFAFGEGLGRSVPTRRRVFILLLVQLCFADGHGVLGGCWFAGVIGGRWGNFVGVVDGRAMGFANREGICLGPPCGVVDGSGAGIVPTGHLLDIFIAKRILFLNDPVMEYSGGAVKFMLIILILLSKRNIFLSLLSTFITNISNINEYVD